MSSHCAGAVPPAGRTLDQHDAVVEPPDCCQPEQQRDSQARVVWRCWPPPSQKDLGQMPTFCSLLMSILEKLPEHNCSLMTCMGGCIYCKSLLIKASPAEYILGGPPSPARYSTYDGAEEAKAGGVPLPSVPRAVPPGRGQRDAQADGPVELASARLNRHHRAEVGLVPQQLCH